MIDGFYYIREPYTDCPACSGAGERRECGEVLSPDGQLEQRPFFVTCEGCKGTGRVESRRVCPLCDRFKSTCRCKRVDARGRFRDEFRTIRP